MANQHTALPMPERFWSRTQYTLTGCLEWMGARQAIGYGVFGKRVAHRVAYEIANGPVPAGLELDHLCGNRWCVEPEHLEPVTRYENIMRSRNFAARNARKTHCPKGHPYSGDNLHVAPNGDRRCRACKKAWNDAHPNRDARQLTYYARLGSQEGSE